MGELVTCPKCGGTGNIKLLKPNKPDTRNALSRMIDNNLAKFAEVYRINEMPKKTHMACPNCRGLGRVRG